MSTSQPNRLKDLFNTPGVRLIEINKSLRGDGTFCKIKGTQEALRSLLNLKGPRACANMLNVAYCKIHDSSEARYLYTMEIIHNISPLEFSRRYLPKYKLTSTLTLDVLDTLAVQHHITVQTATRWPNPIFSEPAQSNPEVSAFFARTLCGLSGEKLPVLEENRKRLHGAGFHKDENLGAWLWHQDYADLKFNLEQFYIDRIGDAVSIPELREIESDLCISEDALKPDRDSMANPTQEKMDQLLEKFRVA